jgi:anti-sigma regulatory factor (Ser/Thr protein kinase)
MKSEVPESCTRILLMDLRRDQDVVLCRKRARTISAALRFDQQNQVRIATAVSEIARNAFRYGTRATAEFTLSRHRTGASRNVSDCLVVIVRDRGPGIADLASVPGGTYRSESGESLGTVSTIWLHGIVRSLSIHACPCAAFWQ